MSRARWTSLVLATVSLVCVALPFALDAYGISNDTNTYVSTAHNLVDGNGYKAANGTTPVEFAPLYPALLASLFALGFSDAAALGVINVAAMAFLLFAIARWVRAQTESKWANVWIVGVVGFGYPVLYVAQWGWSETLFLAFTAGAWTYADAYIRQRNPRTLVIATTLIALACLTRYAGVIFLFATCAMVFAQASKTQASKTQASKTQASKTQASKKGAVALAVGGAIPLAVWLVVNRLSQGSAAGERGPSHVSLVRAIELTLDVVGKWMIGSLPQVMTITAAVLLLVWLLRGVVRNGMKHPVSLSAVCAMVYGAAIIVIAGVLTGISPPNDRLVLPLYPFAAMAVVSTIAGKRPAAQAALSIWVAGTVITGCAFTFQRIFLSL